MNAVEEQGPAELTGDEFVLHLQIGGIKAPHISDLNQTASGGDLGLDDFEAFLSRWRKGLLTKHGLTGSNASEGQLAMRVIRRRYEHGIDGRILYDRHGVRRHDVRTRFGSDGLR